MMGISYQKKRQTPKRKAGRSNRPGDASENSRKPFDPGFRLFLFMILFRAPQRQPRLSKMRRHLFPVQRIGDRGRYDLRDPKSMPDALRAAQAAEEEGSRDDEQRVAQQ